MILDTQLIQINGSVEFLLGFSIVFINECFSAKQGLFVTSSRFEGLSFRSCSACLFSDAGAVLQAQRPISMRGGGTENAGVWNHSYPYPLGRGGLETLGADTYRTYHIGAIYVEPLCIELHV